MTKSVPAVIKSVGQRGRLLLLQLVRLSMSRRHFPIRFNVLTLNVLTAPENPYS